MLNERWCKRLHKAKYCMFGEAINGVGLNREEPRHRCSNHNVATAIFCHGIGKVGDAEHDSVDIDGTHSTKICKVEFKHRFSWCCSKNISTTCHTSIQKHHIERFVLRSKFFPLFFARDIVVLVSGTEFLCECSAESIVDIGNEDVVAHVGPVACNAGTNSASAPCNENAMLCHGFLSSFV